MRPSRNADTELISKNVPLIGSSATTPNSDAAGAAHNTEGGRMSANYNRSGARTPLLPAHETSTRNTMALSLFVVLAVVLTACGSDKKSSPSTTVAATTPVPSTATPVASSGTTSGGTTGGSLVVGTDLPLQGDFSADINLAVALLLEQKGGKAGTFEITIKEYDSSTVDLCKTNGSDHVANEGEIAIMGTYSSGCAKFELPVLNADPAGPLLMISPYNTNLGLTKAGDPDEPDKYYPTGIRNYGRLIATEDREGRAEAEFAAKELGVTKCVVLDDAESYGVNIAQGFEEAAKAAGIAIVATAQWDGAQSDYTTLFEGFKGLSPDCFFFGGTGDVNGEQLIRDKVAVFGPNTGAVKLLAPDGFIGYEEIQQLPESEGMYLSYIGLPLSELVKAGSAAAEFADAFKTKYGHDPNAEAMYGAAALQFILAAIEGSDGTRKDVVREAFSGIIVPANESLIGRELSIDENGDTTIGDASIEILTGGVETFVKAWPV
jgi:branched-chain amino acid transport system substrate-binding protein